MFKYVAVLNSNQNLNVFKTLLPLFFVNLIMGLATLMAMFKKK